MGKTIATYFKEIADQYSDKRALSVLSQGTYFDISYSELDKARLTLAKHLKDRGLKHQSKLAIMLANSPEWIISDLAAATLGAVLVPLHTTYNSGSIKRIIKHSETDFLIIHIDYYRKFKTIFDQLSLKNIIIVGGNQESVGQNNDVWPEPKGDVDEDITDRNISEDGLHTIIYTSGTMGDPKGVMLSHKNLLSNVLAAKKAIKILSEDRFFSFLPLSHAFERTAGYYVPIFSGASIFFAQSTKTLIDDIKIAKPTILSSVPRIFEKMYRKIFDKVETSSVLKRRFFFKGIKLSALKRSGSLSFLDQIKWKLLNVIVLQKVRNALGGNLRMAISGGASLDHKIIKFFDNIGIKIIEGYGMTETSPIITVNRLESRRFGTVGQALNCNEIKIKKDKEILLRGDNLMLGYFKDATATQEIVDDEGWFHTGDLGFLDGDGFLSIIGRAKDVIVLSTGKNIFPEPIENLLNESRYIEQSMVYGDNEKHISALIVPNVEHLKLWCQKKVVEYDLTGDKIMELYKREVEKKLNYFSAVEKINHFIIVEQEFSQENGMLTPTLKLRRKKILDKVKN